MTPQSPPAPFGSAGRQAILRRLALLYAPPEEPLDRLTRLAARSLAAPVATIVLVEGEALRCRSAIGLGEPGVKPRPAAYAVTLAQRVLAARQPWLVEDATRDPRLDGDEAAAREAVSYLAVPLIAADGDALGAFVVADHSPRAWRDDELRTLADLAALALTEIELRAAGLRSHETQALLDTLMATAPIGLAFWDSELRYVRINDFLARVNGRPAAEHLGLTVQEVLGELGERLAVSLRQVLQSGEPLVNQEWNAAVPAEPWRRGSWLVSSYPIRDREERTYGVGAVVADITERKQAEEAQRFLAEASGLLAGSLELETTLQSVAQLVVPRLADWCGVDVLTADGHLEQVAAAHADPGKERLAAEAQRRYPPNLDSAEGVARAIRSGRSVLYPDIPDDLLHRVARGDGHLGLLRELGLRSAMIVPLLARGRTLGAIMLVAAESGRRYSTRDLALAEDLAGRCAMAVDNARLFRELQDALRTRDEFLASAAHDLKTPLTAIKGLAQLVRTRLVRAGMTEERILEGLRSIDASASRMTGLINELLDVARLEMGQPLSLDRRPVDLVVVARGVLDELRQTSQRHQLSLTVEDAAEMVGNWDAARLERVLQNLVSNAIKYSPEGGPVAVRIRGEQDAQGQWAVLSMADRGLGVPKDDLPHIFERYRRGRNVAGRIAGTGIGLAGAYQIVQQHGGTITAESREGVGSTFTVRLPLDWAADDDEQGRAPDDEPGRATGAG